MVSKIKFPIEHNSKEVLISDIPIKKIKMDK